MMIYKQNLSPSASMACGYAAIPMKMLFTRCAPCVCVTNAVALFAMIPGAIHMETSLLVILDI